MLQQSRLPQNPLRSPKSIPESSTMLDQWQRCRSQLLCFAASLVPSTTAAAAGVAAADAAQHAESTKRLWLPRLCMRRLEVALRRMSMSPLAAASSCRHGRACRCGRLPLWLLNASPLQPSLVCRPSFELQSVALPCRQDLSCSLAQPAAAALRRRCCHCQSAAPGFADRQTLVVAQCQ